MAWNPYSFDDPRYLQQEQLEETRRQNELIEHQNYVIETNAIDAEKRWLAAASPDQRAAWAKERYKTYGHGRPLQVDLYTLSPAFRDELVGDRALYNNDPWQFHLLCVARMTLDSPEAKEQDRIRAEQQRFEKKTGIRPRPPGGGSAATTPADQPAFGSPAFKRIMIGFGIFFVVMTLLGTLLMIAAAFAGKGQN
jgi:hypothetical protein